VQALHRFRMHVSITKMLICGTHWEALHLVQPFLPVLHLAAAAAPAGGQRQAEAVPLSRDVLRDGC
jgi:hypothetical protein